MNENKPDIENIELHLSLTASLVGAVCQSYLQANHKGVWDAEIRSALIEHRYAYDLCRNYKYLSDSVVIIEERVSTALDMLAQVIEEGLPRHKEAADHE